MNSGHVKIREGQEGVSDWDRVRHELYYDARKAAWIGLSINLALAVIKFIAGLVGQSMALLADAVNSLGDTITTTVVIVAMNVARRPADEEHPYGHTRVEAIAGSSVAIIIAVVAALTIWKCFEFWDASQVLPPIWTLWIAAGNVIIKESLYHYKKRVGMRIGSSALIATAWDHRSDAFCSLAVLIGLSAVLFTDGKYLHADKLAGMVVGTMILISSAKLYFMSANELLDAQGDGLLLENIRVTAALVAGVTDVEKLRVRKSGLEYFADIHVHVPPQLTVAKAHRLGHEVKDKLLTTYPRLRDVLVHIEPDEPLDISKV
ncbi:MAG: cation transporter [Phycisphaeraceae bacterium]|nr:cation transporter [Phycisphaeraceae bacterium]